MQKLFKSVALFAALGLSAAAFTGCDVDVDEGEMPELKGGEAPNVDIEGPEIETKTKEVEVPTGIKVPKEGSEDPDVD